MNTNQGISLEMGWTQTNCVVFSYHAYPGFAPVYEEVPKLIKELGPGRGFEEFSTTPLGD
jgi:hypothetical protein